MTLAERVQEFSSGIVAGLAASVVAAGTWVVRRLLTNEKQIALLQAEIAHRGQQRQEDREAIARDIDEVKQSVKRIENVLLGDGK